jgi:lipoate-protein ligase A
MFPKLDLLIPMHPAESFDGPMQMALDEVLLRQVSVPTLRIYKWKSPWVTFGYFQEMKEVQRSFPSQPVVRRWTGGGMVSHGEEEELTFSLMIPAGEKIAAEAPTFFYKQLHGKLAGWIRSQLSLSVNLAGSEDVKPGSSCFQSPANDDLLIQGRKVLGGALRRCGGGLLYQGSLKISDIPGWDYLRISPMAWAAAFGDSQEPMQLDRPILSEAEELVRTRYGTTGWNHRK